MSWRVALVALCGCNQIFGLNEVIAVDAQQFDAPIDAPYTCPGVGTAPVFKRVFNQITTRTCLQFSFGTRGDRALGVCSNEQGDPNSFGFVEGSITGNDLAPAVGMEGSETVAIDTPRLTPEGDEVYLRRSDSDTGVTSTVVYRRAAGGWVFHRLAGIPATAGDIAAITAAPNRRAFVMGSDGLHEWADDGNDTWTDNAVYTPADLGVMAMLAPGATGDGLRLVFPALTNESPFYRFYYVDRADLASRFGTAKHLVGVPGALLSSPAGVFLFGVLADDCSRLYFSGLDSVFYFTQQ